MIACSHPSTLNMSKTPHADRERVNERDQAGQAIRREQRERE